MRLDAIEQIGGFTPGHLTEDLDLTDRFWIGGWKGVYLGNVVNYGEVPYAYDHFRRQQERWVAGTARALKDYFRPLLATPHLVWFHKMGAIRQNAYYTTGLFTVLALLVGAATLLWIYTGRDTYPVEYYLYLIERCRTPLMIIVYLCLLSNLVEILIMIVVKKRTYADLLHAPMAVWYAWSTLATYVVGNLKGLFGIHLGWFLTPKFLRGSVGAFSVVPNGMRTINRLICAAFIVFFFLEGAIIGGGDVFAVLWIPAFLLASME
jgi:cellulose synthase/poly-beta-1,6-N-acetylglucosamine synthase-like glycosyltransferase